jgi:hypothetical protein
MDIRAIGYAISAGLATASVAFGVTTQLFSSVAVFAFALVGIPAGLVTGILIAVFVFKRYKNDPQQDLVLALGTFGIAYLATGIMAAGLGYGIFISIGVSALVGTLVGAIRILLQ